MNYHKRKVYFYVFIILLLFFIPLNGMGRIEKTMILEIRLDYIFHIFLFLPWAFLEIKVWGMKRWQWLLLGLVFAAGAEFMHYFLPYRSFNINDLIGNVAGIILGWGMRTIWKLINLKI